MEFQKYLQQFVDEVMVSQQVFTAESKEGMAISNSSHFNDDQGNPVGVFCFWSSKSKAKECCVDEWYDFVPVEISLATFIEDYCVGIYNDSLVVGINFDAQMFGIETDPIDLILMLLKEAKLRKLELDFEHFKDLDDIQSQIEKMFGPQ